MKKVELQAKAREKIGKSVKALRERGLVPAVVYGGGMEPEALELDVKSFDKIISGVHGSNVIITLNIEGGKKAASLPVITHDIQRDNLTDKTLHVDFLKIKLDEKIKTKVHVLLSGISIGVKDDGGILISGLREIEVKCLPTEIPEKFELDVSELKIGDSLHVSDIKSVKGVEIVTEAAEMLANIVPPAKVEEVAPLPAGAVPGVEGAPAVEGVAAAPA
ncbi:MAG: 50S ribosomal protein L25, partial [Candidatus Saganbacteria bacterium]|nr:50S ribosomal protein L25 [Candidatus Saganbacteria bacterium]